MLMPRPALQEQFGQIDIYLFDQLLRGRIAPHAARIIAHVMWDYTEAQTNSAAAAAPYSSMMGILVFDCVTLRFGGAGSVAYSGLGGDGEAVAQFSIDPDSAPLGTSEPGTIGRDLVTYVCAHAPQSKA